MVAITFPTLAVTPSPFCVEQQIVTTVGILTFGQTRLFQIGSSKERCNITGKQINIVLH